jgi:hypothetical protein
MVNNLLGEFLGNIASGARCRLGRVWRRMGSI